MRVDKKNGLRILFSGVFLFAVSSSAPAFSEDTRATVTSRTDYSSPVRAESPTVGTVVITREETTDVRDATDPTRGEVIDLKEQYSETLANISDFMEHLIPIIQQVESKPYNIEASMNEITPYLNDAIVQINVILSSEYAGLVSQDLVDIVNDQLGKVKALAEISRLNTFAFNAKKILAVVNPASPYYNANHPYSLSDIYKKIYQALKSANNIAAGSYAYLMPATLLSTLQSEYQVIHSIVDAATIDQMQEVVQPQPMDSTNTTSEVNQMQPVN